MPGFLGIAQTLAVGRIGDQDAVRVAAGQLLERLLLEVNQRSDSGLLGVAPGQPQRGRVDVGADNAGLEVRPCQIARFFASGLPQRRRDLRPGLRREIAVQAGREIAADQRRLDGDRPAPAERIEQTAAGLPETQQNQRRCQRLFQRRLPDQCPVTPLVETPAGGVDAQRGHVVPDRDVDRVAFPRFGEPFGSVGRLQPADDRLFDDLLTGRHAGQLAADTAAVDGEIGVGGQPLLPRQLASAVEQLAKVFGGKLGHADQNPVGCAQPDVRAADRVRIAAECDPAGLAALGLVTEGLQFPRRDGFQPERGGGDEIDR